MTRYRILCLMSELASKAVTAAGGHGTMPPQLKRYWLHGLGAAKIRWGEGGDYNRAVTALLAEGIPEKYVHGIAGNLHEEALGISTAEHKHLLSGGDQHANTSAATVLHRGLRE